MATDGRLVKLALLAQGFFAQMLGPAPLGEALERPARSGSLHQLRPPPLTLAFGLLEAPELVAQSAAQVSQYSRGVLDLSERDSRAVAAAASQAGHDRLMSSASALEVGPAGADSALRPGQPALGLLLIAAAQVKGSLQRELVLAHAASPCSAKSMVSRSLNYRRERREL